MAPFSYVPNRPSSVVLQSFVTGPEDHRHSQPQRPWGGHRGAVTADRNGTATARFVRENGFSSDYKAAPVHLRHVPDVLLS